MPEKPRRPVCQRAGRPVNYAQALAQAIVGNTLPQGVNDALTGLLHDMVYLLVDFVREPYLQP
ncbi:hypothetical protein [Enterobacter genomosp. O]|uniref:hypothetical protein n=1 Tax=Enterobacter genomosp. O TaxID=2364150 RepID=UPI000AD17C0B